MTTDAATRGRLRLYALQGSGSAIIEAQLVWYGLDHDLEPVGDLFADPAARASLAMINPLEQVPVLILPSGAVMTESAAITLYLSDLTGRSDLVPEPDAPERAEFLRWLMFLVANVYPVFTYADHSARFVDAAGTEEYLARVRDWQARLLTILDASAQAPWFLGARMSAIDIYLAVMVHWTPRRAWFDTHAPALAGIADRAAGLPELAPVLARNFPEIRSGG